MNHLYEVATGRLVSSTSLPVNNPPAGMAVKASDRTGIWNTSTLDFDPAPVPEASLERINFLRLFTRDERVAIRAAAKIDPVVEDFMDMLSAANLVRLGNADTIAGVNYMASQGLLTPQRAAEVLGG